MGTRTGPVITGVWAARLPGSARERLAALRQCDGLQVQEVAADIWVRGVDATPALQVLLQALPGAERFVVDEKGLCRLPGLHLPAAQLPAGPWQELRDFVGIVLPKAALAAARPDPMVLTLARCTTPEVPSVLQTTLRALLRWVDAAAAVRMRGLRFAAASDGRVLVHGQPLPPLAGNVFVEAQGLVVPAGHAIVPPCSASLVAARLGLDVGDLALFAVDGSCVRVRASDFVALTRAAVRITAAEVARG